MDYLLSWNCKHIANAMLRLPPRTIRGFFINARKRR
jgi:hypothetical protein